IERSAHRQRLDHDHADRRRAPRARSRRRVAREGPDTGARDRRDTDRRGLVSGAAEPTIALAFTPDPWVEELHRHCTDHGGARVRQVLIDPALALEEQYDVLVVSHRWGALTHGLVDDLHARCRKVLGVYERGEPVGHDWLVAVGTDATVASDDGAAGIVAALR